MEKKIVTSGWKMGSPFPSRRVFTVEADFTLDELEALQSDFLLWREESQEIHDFEKYYKSFCEYCKKSDLGVCFRHRTVWDVMDLVGNQSNLPYVYEFNYDDEGRLAGFEFELGAGGWKISGDEEKITVKRPSGVTFTYRNHRNSEASSYMFIIRAIRNWLKFLISVGYTDFKFKV